jgi:hypothetical protein
MKGNIEADKLFPKDILTDFSNHYGNEATKELMIEWLEEKMGGRWRLQHLFITKGKDGSWSI